MTHRCKSKQKRRKLEIIRRWKRKLKRKKLEQKLQKQQVEQPTVSKIESTGNS